eukprot:Skav232797  [mRNA]  locus=scaffold614:305573:308173:+ [translate_table: standard]
MTGTSGGQTGKGVAVTFSKLTYTVPVKKDRVSQEIEEKLDIIKDLNGVFHPGRLTALMGPSGSGKTTLMDILAGRKSGAGKIQGEVLYGGSPAPRAVLKLAKSAKVLPRMLMYTAEMKLPLSTPKAEKRKRVDNAKRVNVALALISQPMVVFLDEPTSGLDSKMANEVCAIL